MATVPFFLLSKRSVPSTGTMIPRRTALSDSSRGSSLMTRFRGHWCGSCSPGAEWLRRVCYTSPVNSPRKVRGRENERTGPLMTLHVTLPDGSPLELDDGATVRDAAAAIGPRLAKAAIAGPHAAVDPDEPARRRRRAAPRRRPARHRHAQGRRPRRRRHPAPHRLARHGAGHPAPVPGRQVRHRADHRERLLLRLPASPSPSPRPTWRASRRRWPRSSARTCRWSASRCRRTRRWRCSGPESPARAPPACPRARPAVQGRADRGPVTAAEAGTRPGHQRLPPGRVRRPVPRPAPAEHRTSSASGTFKLTSLAGAYWRGDEKNADAHPHLRHRLPEQGGAGGVPRGARAGPPARPPPHRPRPRPLQLPRGGPRLPVLPPQGHAPLERDDRLLARRARARRLRGDQHAA